MVIKSESSNKEESYKKRYHRLITFFSGGMAGCLSGTLTMPLEVIKTQLQVSTVTNPSRHTSAAVASHIWKTERLRGFFRGLGPLLVGTIPKRAIYFCTYDGTKEILRKGTSMGESSMNHLLSAFSAGIMANTITAPIWVVKTRYQILPDISKGQKHYSNYREVVRDISKKEGFRGFFKGLPATYFGCAEGAIQWMIYEKLKVLYQQEQFLSLSWTSAQQNSSLSSGSQFSNQSPSVFYLFFASGISKLIASCSTYPHEVVRTRLREQPVHGKFKYKGVLQTVRVVLHEEGMR
jgi:solute carrier family 25 protein 33/36